MPNLAIESCHERNSSWSPNVLVGPGVKKRVQQVAIDYCSVACVLEGQKREVTREGPMECEWVRQIGVK